MSRVNEVVIKTSVSGDPDLYQLNCDGRGLDCVATSARGLVDSENSSALMMAAIGGDALATLACESGGRIVENYPEPQYSKAALALDECYDRRGFFDETDILTK